jgi:hypothetical protein
MSASLDLAATVVVLAMGFGPMLGRSETVSRAQNVRAPVLVFVVAFIAAPSPRVFAANRRSGTLGTARGAGHASGGAATSINSGSARS